MTTKVLVVGAGFSGAVIAYELAKKGIKCKLIDKRKHLGGNCYTEVDGETGILLHKYGPHIFHTDDLEVWNYLDRFVNLKPYVNRVKAIANNNVYSLPINLLTINQFFKKTFSPSEAKEFINSLTCKIERPLSFEDQALSFVGTELYEAFFKGYTKKQWGMEPSKLPASILKRLPLRFDYNDNYFSHSKQGIPENGYTVFFEKVLNHPNIEVALNQEFNKDDMKLFNHVFYSGSLDEYYNYTYGRLEYRTLDFELFRDLGDFQGTAVMNYCDESIPYTRITEHKHFMPWKKFDKTIYYKEFSRKAYRNEDIPYYPINLVEKQDKLENYKKLALVEPGVTFVGRLGRYQYMDMDVTIRQALDTSSIYLQCLKNKVKMPSWI